MKAGEASSIVAFAFMQFPAPHPDRFLMFSFGGPIIDLCNWPGVGDMHSTPCNAEKGRWED